MEKAFKNCQSCGMPMHRDDLGGGTNADGSKSVVYCSKCWQGGTFTSPDMTVVEMKALVKEKLKSFGFPGFIAGIFTRKIPKLERWK
ncbi:MAG: zinc ribbon domain-containing protein [Saprospiraceae bacterium]